MNTKALCLSVKGAGVLLLLLLGCNSTPHDYASCVKQYVEATESTVGQLALTGVCRSKFDDEPDDQATVAFNSCILERVTGAKNWMVASAAIEQCESERK